MQLFLASASPRRSELLALAGLSFAAVPADVDEAALPGETAPEYVGRLALAKAEGAFALVREKCPGATVLGADTAVEADGRVLGKPRDGREAREMLLALSGRGHTVSTGLAAIRGGRTLRGLVQTYVSFRELSLGEIDAYIGTGEPLDKAGAYAIQGRLGPSLVDRVEGSLSNVVGLPLRETLELLREISAGG